MNNSVFGKTMEDVRNRENMHLTIDRDNAIKWFSKIEFKHANFVDGLYLIQTHKTATLYDKPVYVGCAILDLSKERMLDFHYNSIEKKLKGKYDLLYSDTLLFTTLKARISTSGFSRTKTSSTYRR